MPSPDAPTPGTTERPTHAELVALLDAPDLTPRERRQLVRMARFQKRVETWEARHAQPYQPRRAHRIVITLVSMGAMLWLLWLLTFASN